MCAIFGLIDYSNHFNAWQREKILKVLSHECEVRGKDATGYAYLTKSGISIYKRPVPANKLHLHLPLSCNTIMGHTRMATQGKQEDNFNNHPFYGQCGDMPFALAHNGVLHNDYRLRSELKLPKTHIETDSYIAVQLLEQHETLDMNSIAKMAEQVEGSFVFAILDAARNMYFVKGDNPLALYHFKRQGFYIYASTEQILLSALVKLGMLAAPYDEVEAANGDIIRIDSSGEIERGNFTPNDYTDWSRYFYNYNSGYWNDIDFGYPEADPVQVRQLKEFSSLIGVDERHIDLLLDYGYTVEDIEELMYIPNALQGAIDELLCEFEYCEEW